MPGIEYNTSALTASQVEGQWFGAYSGHGESKGEAVLCLERRNGKLCGSLVTIEAAHQMPSAMYRVVLDGSNATKLSGEARLTCYVDLSNNRCVRYAHAKLRERYPMLDEEITQLKITARQEEGKLLFGYVTDTGFAGTAVLSQHAFKAETSVDPLRIEWQEFKQRLTDERMADYIFRGQSWPFPLRTSFHRAGRTDISRFALEDIVRLESAIASVTDTAFDTTDQRVVGALLGIAQHHGYPTPLMDWTRSPYVAAYFACKDVVTSAQVMPTIFAFDWREWQKRKGSAAEINTPLPALSFIEPVPLKNPRLMPQQSVLMYCNVHNIERFVMGDRTDSPYLKSYVLTGNPTRILRDLRMMGIYAASLFPGLDGMCRGVFEQSLEATDTYQPIRSQVKPEEPP